LKIGTIMGLGMVTVLVCAGAFVVRSFDTAGLPEGIFKSSETPVAKVYASQSEAINPINAVRVPAAGSAFQFAVPARLSGISSAALWQES
jgi:hypothetical protein